MLVKKPIAIVLILVCLVSLLLNLFFYPKAAAYGHLVAVSWGDSKYAPALYGVYVYCEPVGNRLQVRAVIYIDRPTLWQSYQHDIIELGLVDSDSEAVARWGQISWSADGVRVGNGDHAVLVKTTDLEKHR
jgi:hypothetical protein